jgi:hypothetical protein
MPIVDAAIQYATEHPAIAVVATAGAVTAAYIVHASTPKLVPDLPGPTGWPIVGSFFSRGFDPAETYRQWSEIYGPVFRHRLGANWVIVVNGADAADELMASPKFAASTQSRPQGWTFRKLLQIDPRSVTLASQPWGDVLKKKRLLVIKACEPAALHSYDECVDWGCKRMVRDFWEEVKKNDGVVDPFPIIRQLAKNHSAGIHFGCTMEEAEKAYDMKKPMRILNQ